MSKKIIKDLQAQKSEVCARLKPLNRAINMGIANEYEIGLAQKLEDQLRQIDADMARAKIPADTYTSAEFRGIANNGRFPVSKKNNKRAVRGAAMETLTPDQSMTDYAYACGYLREDRTAGTDFDWDAYWGQKLGVSPGSAELRNDPFKAKQESRAAMGMGEDISAGGQALVAQIWSTSITDLIRAKTFVNQFNATTLPLKTETTNYPVWTSDIAPAYIANDSGGTALNLDLSPSVGSVVFNCAGAFADITSASYEIIEDAVTNGGIDGLIRHSIAEKYARLVDSVVIYGQTGSTGNPGLLNETATYVSGSPGIMTQSMGTNGAAPTTYADISKAVAQIRAQSAEPSGMVWHPNTAAEYAQLKDTLNQPMRPTPDVANLVNGAADSALLNYGNETQGNTSTNSSLYIADWSYCFLGMRLDGVEVTPISERYVEFMQRAWLSRIRMSIRWFWPNKVACRLLGIQ